MSHYTAMYEEKPTNGKEPRDGPSLKSTKNGITKYKTKDLLPKLEPSQAVMLLLVSTSN